MYAYSTLGENGRFGNQMFQYATLYALSKYYSTEFIIPTGEYEILDAFPNLSAKQMPKEDIIKSVDQQYREEKFTFSSNLFLIRENTDIHGYFQSENYFSEFREGLLKEFQFSDKTIEQSKKKLNIIHNLYGQTLCAIHFRKGDYKDLADYHTNLGPEYYNTALQWVIDNVPNVTFIAFSDDLDWCRANLPPDVVLSNADDQYQDMYMMSMCDYHIIANSSFSWWGAWLSNTSKQVIAPKKWFESKGPPAWDSIYPKGWGVCG